MHGVSTAAKRDEWRANLLWVGLAILVAVASLATNLAEIFYAYVLHDPRAIVGRNLADAFFDDLGRMLMCLAGLVILWRAGNRKSCFLLGVGIIALIPFPPLAPEYYPWFDLIVAPVPTYMLPAFALARLRESGLRVRPAIWWLFAVLVAVSILVWIIDNFVLAPVVPARAAEALTLVRTTNYFLAMGLTALLLLYGHRRASTQEGQRFFILLVAVTILMLGNALFSMFNSNAPIFPRWVTNTSSLIRITGAFLFAYAILKHRIIDIGFAINRTLVYGAVTFTLLAAFGLAEFATKSLIPLEGARAGSIITAATALLVFLSFHHVHRWLEHQIERLFFHSWHVAEAQLNRFVTSAGHFTSEGALCAAFADELRRYSRGAEVALFLRREGTDFSLQAGSLAGTAKSYPDDDRAFALMRAERQPIELAHALSTLPGELAAPMLDQRGLAGFVLVGAKPDGSHLRPDQEEKIGWATQQIGLDIQALKARALDEELSGLRRRLAAAEAERDRLASALAMDRNVALEVRDEHDKRATG